MLAGEFSSRWIGTQIPYKCIIAHASTNGMILFSLIAANGCGMIYCFLFRQMIRKLPNIKRVIGLPGETVEVRNGKVYADGMELDNSFVKGYQNRTGDGIYVVPEGCYFFLGDNRNNSRDSRFWKEKYIPLENIQAKAERILFPFSDAGLL